MGKVTRPFCWHQNFVHKGLSAPALGLYTCGKTLKNVYKIKEICLKLATNGRSDKGFLLTSEVCPQGVFCPCPGAIDMYKIIKNVYKIRFRRDHFETCNKWAKWHGLSVDIRILSTKGCLPLPWGYIHVEKHKKMCIKSEFKEICLKLATNGRGDKGFLLTSKVCPQGFSALAPELYTCIKSLKMCIKSDFEEIILKLATYGQREKAFLFS